MKPKFNNIPNKHIQVKIDDNKIADYWISRSVAVVGVVLAKKSKDNYDILIVKRSDNMPDEAGKYCLPCGYTDFGETVYDTMIREVYEETGLYLTEYENIANSDKEESNLMFYNFDYYNNDKKPVFIDDNPNSTKQNISFIYLTMLDFSKNITLYPKEIEEYSDNETELVRWISLDDFIKTYDKGLEWAFGHNEVIKDVIKNYLNIIN